MTDLITDSDAAADAVQRYCHAGNPSAYMAFNAGNEYFRMRGHEGFVVYRPTGRYLVQLGGPFAPPHQQRALVHGFARFATEQDRSVVAVQVQSADAAAFLAEGFTMNQMGSSYVVGLDSFSLHGTRFMQLRNKISRALRSGLVISEVDWDDECAAAVREVDLRWLSTKGDGAKPLEFLIGETGGRHQHLRRLFLGERDGEVIGYVSYSPVYGPRLGWMHDLSRRRPDSGPGVMEAINMFAIDRFRGEGVSWLHLGFTPFTHLTAPRLPGYSRGFQWFIEHLWEHGEQIYPARTQLAYKEKWAPDVVLPEYLAFQHGASLPALVHVFRACNAV